MKSMVKTQVYLPAAELTQLHRIAREKKRAVAELVREAVRKVWLQPSPEGPVALFGDELRGSSVDHDSAFDEI